MIYLLYHNEKSSTSMEKKKNVQSRCEDCENYMYDEDEETYFCAIDLDEDEMMRFMTYSTYNCPYYRTDDEYRIVRKQN